MTRRRQLSLWASTLTLLPAAFAAPVFEVTVAPSVASKPFDGRLLVLLSTDPSDEPRNQINDGPTSRIVFGFDVNNWKPGAPLLVGASANGYPVRTLSDLKPGDYTVQAPLDLYETYHLPGGRILKLPSDRGEGRGRCASRQATIDWSNSTLRGSSVLGSPRRAPVAAATSRNTGRHHGPVADLVRRSCSDDERA